MAFQASSNDVVVPPNPSNIRVLKISRHFGKGIDDVAETFRRTLEQLLSQQVLRPASVVGISAELQKFLAFCVSYRESRQIKELRLADMDQEFSDLWAHNCLHLVNSKTCQLMGVTSRRHIYSVPRLLMTYAKSFGIIAHVPLTTQRVLFPRSKEKVASSPPYSSKEFASIITALRKELATIDEKHRDYCSSYLLALRALLVVIRTGLNLTPLLELNRNCLRPHPVDPKRFVLTATKHRANRLVSVSLRSSNTSIAKETPHDAVLVIQKTLEETAMLAAEASSPLSEQLWLFQSRGQLRGITTRLTHNLMNLHMARFARSNQLRDDRGRPLIVNTRRMRKTFINRIYEKSSGDLFVTAQIANNTPRVSDVHYLMAPDDGERAFAIAGSRVVEILKNSSKPKKGTTYLRTAIAGCQDPLFGERAPGDGHTYCEKFMHCFSCKNMVVAGNDLHRMYSFYWFLTNRLASVRSTPMYGYFKAILRLIDEDIATRFDQRSTELAKLKARENPHPIWQKANLI